MVSLCCHVNQCIIFPRRFNKKPKTHLSEAAFRQQKQNKKKKKNGGPHKTTTTTTTAAATRTTISKQEMSSIIIYIAHNHCPYKSAFGIVCAWVNNRMLMII